MQAKLQKVTKLFHFHSFLKEKKAKRVRRMYQRYVPKVTKEQLDTLITRGNKAIV